MLVPLGHFSVSEMFFFLRFFGGKKVDMRKKIVLKTQQRWILCLIVLFPNIPGIKLSLFQSDATVLSKVESSEN
jgi:hypothetical protein